MPTPTAEMSNIAVRCNTDGGGPPKCQHVAVPAESAAGIESAALPSALCSMRTEGANMADKSVRFIIKRQPTPESRSHWEEFDLRWRPGMNVIIGLMDIAENPVDRFGINAVGCERT